MQKQLPKELTSYDFVKTFAILTMVIDHIGYYFFPELEVLRAIGRASLPAWLFLIGFARTRDVDFWLIAGAIVLVWANIAAGMSVFPLNILVTIIITRMLIDWLAFAAFRKSSDTIMMSLALILLALPSLALLEYGTLAFYYALIGYAIRHRAELPTGEKALNFFNLAGIIMYAYYQIMLFNFGTLNFLITFILAVGLSVYLLSFRRTLYRKATNDWPDPVVGFFKICGRYTLIIYVGHLVLFKFVALALGLGGLSPFEWQWFGQ